MHSELLLLFPFYWLGDWALGVHPVNTVWFGGIQTLFDLALEGTLYVTIQHCFSFCTNLNLFNLYKCPLRKADRTSGFIILWPREGWGDFNYVRARKWQI